MLRKCPVWVMLISGALTSRVDGQVIETYSAWQANLSFYYSAWGGTEGMNIIGETFVAPNTRLDSWSFWLAPSTDPVQYTANLATWTGSGIGSMLWSSPTRTLPGGLGFTELSSTWDVGSAPQLNPGQPYFFFLAAIAGSNEVQVVVPRPFPPGGIPDPYADGHQWQRYGSGSLNPNEGFDLTFRAEFSGGSFDSTVPEPVSMVLLASGLVGLAAARRRWSPASLR